MFDQLKFWKKESDPFSDFDKNSAQKTPVEDPFAQSQNQFEQKDPFATDSQPDFQMPTLDSMQSSFAQNTPTQKQSFEQQPTQHEEIQNPKDIELILSRLDLIRSELQNVNHRITNIEQQLNSQSQNIKKEYW